MAWGDIKDRINERIYKSSHIVPGRICIGGDGVPEKWPIFAVIQRVGSHKPPKTFYAKGKFASSEEEAVRLAMEYAKYIIDAAIPGGP